MGILGMNPFVHTYMKHNILKQGRYLSSSSLLSAQNILHSKIKYCKYLQIWIEKEITFSLK